MQKLKLAQDDGCFADPEGPEIPPHPADKFMPIDSGDNLVIDVDPDGIPDELKELRQWVGWRLMPRGEEKPKKAPLNPKTGRFAATNNPNTWETIYQAQAYYQNHKGTGCCGLGFVFTKNDPYVGLDLDGCRNPGTGEIEPWAQEIVQGFNSYTEISVSGEGLHIIVKGVLPGEGKRHDGIEMYDDVHYFTMTGCLLPGANTAIESRQEMVLDLYSRLQGKQSTQAAEQGFEEQVKKSGMGNWEALIPELLQAELTPAGEEILRSLEAGRYGEPYRLLYLGDYKGAGYETPSQADLAMFNFLYQRTGGNPGLVYAIIKETGLGKRKKMERLDYVARTMQAAIDGKDWRPDGQELTQPPEGQRPADESGSPGASVEEAGLPDDTPADKAGVGCTPPTTCGPSNEKVKDVLNPKPSRGCGPPGGLGDGATFHEPLNNIIPLYKGDGVLVTDPVTAPEGDSSKNSMAELILEFARSTGEHFNCDNIVTVVTQRDEFKGALSNKKEMRRLKSTIRQNLSRLTKPSKKRPLPPLEALDNGYYRFRAEEIAAAKAADIDRAAQLRAALRNKYRAKTSEAKGEPVTIFSPLKLEEIALLFPGSLVVISGVTNLGKTTLGLELALKNMDNPQFTQVTYFNSELSYDELNNRQGDFDAFYHLPPGTFEKKVDFITPESMNVLDGQAMAELATMIGPNDLNILDYLTIHDKFYKIGETLELLHRRLKKGILVVFLQKDPEKELGLGGIFNLALTRLAFSLDYDEGTGLRVLRFQKVKKPTIKGSRPEDTEILFDINADRTELIHKGTRPRRLSPEVGKQAEGL